MDDREPTRILILAACPSGIAPLRFDQEFRDIQGGLESAKTPFTVRLHLATRPSDLSREILKFKPHLVHFCGHGDPEFGILLEDESGAPKPVSGEALASLFELFGDLVKCVVLNCCYSRPQAEAIARHVSCVVGMSDLIGDDAAIAFSVGFYEALGEGKDKDFAFKYGLARMQLEGIPEEQVPEIFSMPVQPASPPPARTDRRVEWTQHDETGPVLTGAVRRQLVNGEKSRGRRVFISYARDDESHAYRLCSDLREAGFDPWLDKEKILAGQRWETEIDKAIRESDFFLALLSSKSVDKRGYVQRELRRALDELEKFPEGLIYLIPVRLNECQPPHSQLLRINWLDLFPSYQAGFERLLQALHAGVSPPTPSVETAIKPAEPPSNVSSKIPEKRFGRVVLKEVAGLGLIALLAVLSGHGPPPKPPPVNQGTGGTAGKASKGPLPVITVDGGEAGNSLLENLQGLGFPAEVSLKLDDTALELVLIRKGSFLMGTPPTESGREPDETQHRVVISQPFYIGKYEVTQKQFSKVMTGFFHLNQFPGGQNPVEKVSWNEAQEFCHRLSTQLKGSIRLPTEAEWEYACRAGTSTPFHAGRKIEQLATVSWYRDNSGFVTHPVGGKTPNGWGLFDMHGNVKEWCQDWYSETPGTSPEIVDPQGPQTGIYRVSRGGGIRSDQRFCRSGYRGSALPDRRDHDRGFRIVVALREPAELP